MLRQLTGVRLAQNSPQSKVDKAQGRGRIWGPPRGQMFPGLKMAPSAVLVFQGHCPAYECFKLGLRYREASRARVSRSHLMAATISFSFRTARFAGGGRMAKVTRGSAPPDCQDPASDSSSMSELCLCLMRR